MPGTKIRVSVGVDSVQITEFVEYNLERARFALLLFVRSIEKIDSL